MKARVLGADKLKRRIRTIQAGIPALVTKERLGNFLLKRIQERFLAETGPDGEKWKELSPNTRKGLSILRSSEEHLFKALSIQNGTGGFWSNTGGGFRIGVKKAPYAKHYPRTGNIEVYDPAVYGRFHQFGIGVTRRQFLGISDLDVKAVDSLLRRELKKLVGV